MYVRPLSRFFSFFFFNDTATTEIYTLSLHDALPICLARSCRAIWKLFTKSTTVSSMKCARVFLTRSEEHTSELQSLRHLVCRLLLEKKKTASYVLGGGGRADCAEAVDGSCALRLWR